MLTLKGVTYRYAGARSPSLYDLDLSLPDGEVVGLAGANEAGKSTLCLVASGLAPRAIRGSLSGIVAIDGDDVSDWPMYRMASSVGIAFQNPATQLSGVTETVFEEVCFGPMNLGTPKDELIRRAERALDALHISDLAGRPPEQLSGGQMQLVAVAGLLAMAPRHLVLDEPTAQLDPRGTRLVSDALIELAARGTSILIAEHKTDLLDRLCSRVIVLDGGRIALDGPAATVLADQRLPGLGVAQPARIQLERAMAGQGNPS
jgi:energy-coupling factor transporter ATP-binding protein EcfA2